MVHEMIVENHSRCHMAGKGLTFKSLVVPDLTDPHPDRTDHDEAHLPPTPYLPDQPDHPCPISLVIFLIIADQTDMINRGKSKENIVLGNLEQAISEGS